MGTRAVYSVTVGEEGTAADTPVVLVDLSDTTNFPHTANDGTGEIHLLGFLLNAETKDDGDYDFWIGVISEVDATNGTALWLHQIHCESRDNPTDSSGRSSWFVDCTLGGYAPQGINCKINASEELVYHLSNLSQAGNTNWQTDVGLLSPAGAGASTTGKPGAGDLVMWVEEVTGNTVDWCMTVWYSTAG